MNDGGILALVFVPFPQSSAPVRTVRACGLCLSRSPSRFAALRPRSPLLATTGTMLYAPTKRDQIASAVNAGVAQRRSPGRSRPRCRRQKRGCPLRWPRTAGPAGRPPPPSPPRHRRRQHHHPTGHGRGGRGRGGRVGRVGHDVRFGRPSEGWPGLAVEGASVVEEALLQPTTLRRGSGPQGEPLRRPRRGRQ